MLSPVHPVARLRMRCEALSLIELLITLFVAVVIVVLGVPSMAHWMRTLAVRNGANALVSALQAARSEALARNQEVRVTFGDAQGHAVWVLGCVTVTASCPRRLRGVDASSEHDARWGATLAKNAPALSAPVQAGSQLPAQVTFNAAGAAPAIGNGSEVSRIDIVDANDATVPRLVVLLSASGMVRWCDPLVTAGQPLSCI